MAQAVEMQRIELLGMQIDGDLLHAIKNFLGLERDEPCLEPSRSDVSRSQCDIAGSAI